MKRAALVLGGSGGIGLSTAAMLLDEGYDVTIQGRRDERVQAGLGKLKGDTLGLASDLSREDEIVSAVAQHMDRWGRLDVLVNSAGLGAGQDLEKITSKAFDLQVSINLRAAVIATRECVPHLKNAGAEHGKALIAHVSSWAGVHPPAWLSVYGATKAAVNSFAESSQKELSGSGVQVAAICPATVETEMTTYVQGDIAPEDMLRPEDVAESVRFLLSVSPNCYIPQIILGRMGDL